MEEFYTINQAAAVLKVHPLTIRRYISDRKLKAYRVGGNIRIALNDLRSFTQNFIPRHKSFKASTSLPEQESSSKNFSFSDPLLTLRGKGLSMSKMET
ncbi:hypothetical protein A3C59_03895 [Candidatus Daviesbacteria bacterium RIFCSPHIGHO2_02_FULL_36_13]|uniref:Helix-turn-helix domain-containing protein n=1 Tax=Candidatus Daviesbacteria bacterium RIFCSPHIGHO2_02_FULL_36_13 TaxID=1797768 RepID=A0A1F5JXA5_9BACT|nr:MAG: hypothetical protein A3C59_03895 [Candidatus Daviesbacteria bacterium RIFCSPHIGHO2_02_FULL_36_13]OGE44327.1 MAG: hypothetical protein A3A45_03865 [Candidatus Daviesbacteria bacterium RIFCSPLOWO2_01_FULL_36_8]